VYSLPSASALIDSGVGGSWFGQKPFHFLIVSLERIAHHEKIAVIARDGIPVDNVGGIAILKKSYCSSTT
jgi:hypothetical protein